MVFLWNRKCAWCLRAGVLLFTMTCLPAMSPQSGRIPPPGGLASSEVLQYSIEWRLITAGQATLKFSADQPGWASDPHVTSTGLVSRLFKVDDRYVVNYDPNLCAVSSMLTAHEGLRHRETRIRYDGAERMANYVERDLSSDKVVLKKETEIPPCVYDVIGALYRIRTMNLPVGQSGVVPVSDGKKSVQARVEAQAAETIETSSGTHRTIRYEAFLFNDTLFRRTGRLYIWLTDDASRLPVQIQFRLQFHIGTITLQLEKHEA